MRKFGFWLVLLVLLVAIPMIYKWNTARKEQADVSTFEVLGDSLEVQTPPLNLLYGFAVDSLSVFQSEIKWSQSLATILAGFNVGNERIYQLSNASQGVFDLRYLKAGYPYTIIHEPSELKTARQFIFEPDPTEYVVFNLVDSVYVQRIKREVIREEQSVVATIQSSVYEAVLEQGASPLLVHKLVDVFAWQVDFFRIQKGDEFRVIYEQERVGDKVVGIGKIKGAWFRHFGKEYYAIQFNQGGSEDYFDEQGNSLRKTFLRAPLNYTRISSRYNPRRFHPVLKKYKAHLGTDYAAPVGTEIRTVGDGVIVEATYTSANGNYVKVKHNSNYTTQYLHMSRIAKGIRPGTQVRQGQTIGYVGSTGLANGPHLCFRFWKNGVQVDALKVELPPSEPIDPSRLADYLHSKNVMMTRLQRLQKPAEPTALAQIPSK